MLSNERNMTMAIDKKEMQTRLWAEWTNGLKILADSLMKDQIEIINSACTTVLGNENFIQRAVMYVQRKMYIGKFSDYKTRIGAYETTIMELLGQVNKVCGGGEGHWYELGSKPRKIEYKSTLSDIIIDGDTDFSNEAWGDHAIEAYEKLGNYVNAIMDVLDKAQKELEK